MGSGKKKIEIKRVEKEGQRMVTFSKRRHGLFNKARQLRSLTGADIAILTFSPAGRPYTHSEPSFDALVDRYLNTAAAGEKAEEGCEAAAANHHRLSSWLDALQFDASDSIEDLDSVTTPAKDIWDFLKDRYQTTGLAHQYQLQNQLHQMRQESSQSINDFLSQMHSIWDQLALSEPTWPHREDAVLFTTYRNQQSYSVGFVYTTVTVVLQ
ncbi:agamous-like MADS-box protein AGL29 [Camellia sinensis]|uniref:agamous-like MADS-box protein AGL29 n=1 Tax=Camellia sinensis TaxID=4442 RepID=UPI0010369BAB|nr:agamous-like MADS-box protein AGL29 [Camellia sinensis]